MPLRFSGVESSVALLNATTKRRMLPELRLKSLDCTIVTETKSDAFIGDSGEESVMFYKGYELTLEWQPSNAVSLVEFVGLVIAKSQRKIVDEFAARTKLVSPDGGSLAVTFGDVQFESPSFSLAGQNEFWTSTLKGKGKVIRFQQL